MAMPGMPELGLIGLLSDEVKTADALLVRGEALKSFPGVTEEDIAATDQFMVLIEAKKAKLLAGIEYVRDNPDKSVMELVEALMGQLRMELPENLKSYLREQEQDIDAEALNTFIREMLHGK